ncbi:hypothetical protein ACLOJK_035876 [Asimina triloba]
MRSWPSLQRSSPSVLRNSAIQRLKRRHLLNPAAAAASYSSSSLGESIGGQEERKTASFFQLLLGSVSGAVIVSTLGISLWSSSVGFGDSTAAIATAEDGKQQEGKTKFLVGDKFRRRVFFNYEKRIRLRSSPEKIFDYFASFCSPDGEIFMTPADLMRAIVPVFPPSESNIVREGYLRGERPPGHLHCADSKLFKLFDTNNDGLISFPEEIERDEFKKVMALMRSHNRQGASHRDGLRIGLKIGNHVENGGLVEYFFGKDGDERLQHEKFVQFLKELHYEILCLEFDHYDYKQLRTISAKDFALSMVASADMNHMNKFLDRVEKLDNDPHLRNMRLSFEEFVSFADLRKRLHELSLAMFCYGEVCGRTVTDNMVNVIFHVFDANHDGNLSTEEFFGVMQRRENDIAHPTETGIMGLLSCWWNCKRASPFEQILR